MSVTPVLRSVRLEAYAFEANLIYIRRLSQNNQLVGGVAHTCDANVQGSGGRSYRTFI